MKIKKNLNDLTLLVKNASKLISNSQDKITMIFNYHRIGEIDYLNPFHRLHTISENGFKKQINLMTRLGEIVSLEDIYNEQVLHKINFAITFDDISFSALRATSYLEENNLPWAWGPSIQITENGFGWRDKVYFILKHYSEKEIYEFVHSVLGPQLTLNEEKFSFYHFSKSEAIDSKIIEKEIVNKLFEPIADNKILAEYLNLKGKQEYLSWENLRTFYNDPNKKTHLATLMNHSCNHYNMATLSREEIFNDVEISTKKIYKELNISPKFYAVPFGAVDNNLLIDLNDALNQLSYKSILWVTDSANLNFKRGYSCKSPNSYNKKPLSNETKFPQMLHLSRIHTPVNMVGFLKILILALIRTTRSISSHSRALRKHSHQPEKVVASNDAEKSLSIENLLRYGKDYASSIDYYNYLFTSNPYKKERADYYCIDSNNRVQSIGYNFHMQFSIKGKKYEGIYWAGWRKLPFIDSNNHSMLLLKAMQQEAIIGSYKPNDEVKKAFQSKNWKKIRVNTFRLDKINPLNNSNEYSFRTYSNAPKEIEAIIKASRDQNPFFSIDRSIDYYRWRYDSYIEISNLNLRYHILYKNNDPIGFIVVLSKSTLEDGYFISDYICQSNEDFYRLYSYLSQNSIEEFNNLKNNGHDLSNLSRNILLETSSLDVSNYLETKHPSSLISSFYNYYYFNNKHFKDLREDIDQYFDQSSLHETQATGDILIR